MGAAFHRAGWTAFGGPLDFVLAAVAFALLEFARLPAWLIAAAGVAGAWLTAA